MNKMGGNGRARVPMKKRLTPLPEPELRAILRAADDIIAQGGRTTLAKILKGSKEQKLLELGLDQNPSYGYFKDLTLEQIMDKVDQMIRTDFLETEMRGKYPLIVFTSRGWVIERERRAGEFLQEWDRWLENNVTPLSMEYLKERNRGVIFLFLYKILCSRDKKYIPFLALWERIDFKKVQAEIRHVIQALQQSDDMDDAGWERLLAERAQSLIIRVQDPILMACQSCESPFILDETNPEYYTSDGLRFPDKCSNCMEGLHYHR
ncbi:RQC-minor-1 family DNA-binding protein [Paenibacillus sp. P96]|uniref:RQC-minor-1 family DNA-binding protein n=1 Tax=Paenibacillus zeirhizosphaerae TaxID=2987519 RepID=A0ABT9FXJ2_9BACL|nr:RQC-minor-1 family DNA-binding protein [Paenibacillus sp. P96]MDP4099454.1 RQC-minor-1 family DNA-binding protein [Paenibacillus sp. P96]